MKASTALQFPRASELTTIWSTFTEMMPKAKFRYPQLVSPLLAELPSSGPRRINHPLSIRRPYNAVATRAIGNAHKRNSSTDGYLIFARKLRWAVVPMSTPGVFGLDAWILERLPPNHSPDPCPPGATKLPLAGGNTTILDQGRCPGPAISRWTGNRNRDAASY